jgi:hypothetical protein
MSKEQKFRIPSGHKKNEYHKKTYGHGFYRCKRKPNSPLCKHKKAA